jgi:uncharacterized protein
MSTKSEAERQASTREVEFTAGGLVLRGVLRTPGTAGPHPLVILAHGMGGLKEWTIPEVADALLDADIAALSFDYRNFGDSDGLPREEIDNPGQIEDWQSAITYAWTLPDIDNQRIGIWGTSLGGRNVLAVAALDRRVRCVYAQVPAIVTGPEVSAMMSNGGDVDQFYRDLAEDRRDRALGKEPRYITFDTGPGTDYGQYWAGFGEAERRNWNPRITLRSLEPSLASDIRHLIKLISPTPLRMVLADGDYLEGQMEAYEAALEPKSLIRVEGSHYSVYTTWKDKTINAAREWFTQHLAPAE